MPDAIDALEAIDARRRHDIVLLRAYDVCLEAARRGRFAGRLWSCYILEPERDVTDPEYLAGMTRIADASRHVVCQSEEMRSLLESVVPATVGKTIILSPAVPVETITRPDPGRIVMRMIYAGKFHPFYPVDWMIGAFRELRSEHPDLEFHVAGDKFYRPKGDASYAAALERALIDTPGLHWHGGIGRDEVEALVASGGVALSLWDFRHGPAMNNLVISTKLLDSCSVGIPIILNRTVAQEEVLGADYPLFVTEVDEALPLLRKLLVDPALYRAAGERCFAASRRFTYPAVYAAIAPYVDRVAEEVFVPATGPLRVGVVADGPSEVEAILAPLARVHVDRSRREDATDPVIVIEAPGDRQPPPTSRTGGDRRTILRVTGDALPQGDLSAYDRIILPHAALAAAVLARPGIAPARVTTIPVAIDDVQLARRKLPGAMFNIAVAGVPSPRQRSALLQLQAHLRDADERFRMVVRRPDVDARQSAASVPSSAPDAAGHLAGQPDDDELAWELDDGDPASWYRTVGFVVAAEPDSRQARVMAEAMASGAVPILVGHAGALAGQLLEGGPFGPLEAARRIVTLVRDHGRDDAGARAAEHARSSAGLAAVRAAWVGELA